LAQAQMTKVVKGVGGIEHKVWRSCWNERGVTSYRGFIDGNLVEQFLEMRHESQQKVAQLMGESIDDIQHKVEEVRRCCH
jgi:DNA damage-binding protein 1